MNIKQLKSFSVFKNITDEETKYFLDITEEVRISEGNIFIKEGEVGDSMYMLVDGEVEVNQALTMNLDRHGKDHREKALRKFSSEQLPPSMVNRSRSQSQEQPSFFNCWIIIPPYFPFHPHPM